MKIVKEEKRRVAWQCYLRPAMRMETLEDRNLFAVFSYAGASGSMTIDADTNQVDDIAVTVNGTMVQIQLGNSDTFVAGSLTGSFNFGITNGNSTLSFDTGVTTLNALTVNLGDQDDILTIDSLSNFGANLIVDDGTGADTVNVQGAIPDSGDWDITAETINLNADVSAIGELLFVGNLAVSSTLTIEIDGTAGAGLTGGHDQIAVTGTVSLGGATLDTAGSDIVGASLGDTFVIIDNDLSDSVTGTFNSLANGDDLTANGQTFRIFYDGGDGNDVVLTSVPATLSEVFVNDNFTPANGYFNGDVIADADPNTVGAQLGVIGVNAFAAIQEGIDAVDAGGTAYVTDDLGTDGAGMYVENLTINKNLSLTGTESDAAAVVIDGNNSGRVVAINGTTMVSIDSVTLQHGNVVGTDGGGLWVNTGTVTVSDSVIQDNMAGTDGGGIFTNFGATLNVSGTTISGNSAAFGGGIGSSGTTNVTNSSLIDNNMSIASGGGIFNKLGAGTLTVDDSTISNNTAMVDGGGIFNVTSTIVQNNAQITGNDANFGAGIFSNDSLMVTDSTIDGNDAISQGGGIYNGAGMLSISGSMVSGNSASNGGGIGNASGATANINGTAIDMNMVTSRGGGIHNSGTLIVDASMLTNNTADGDGGGIVNDQGSLTVQNGSTISGNSAQFQGGGIFNTLGMATITGSSSIVSNTATSHGGGIFNDGVTGSIEVTGLATVNLNSANTNGGGIYVNGGTATITGGAAISDNMTSGVVGGLFSQSAEVTLDDASITGNDGRGFDVSGASAFNVTDLTLTGNGSNSFINTVSTVNLDTTTGMTHDDLDINTSIIGGAGNFQLTRIATPQDIVSFNAVTTLEVDFDAGNDSVTVAPHLSTSINLDGGAPTSALSGDSLLYRAPIGETSTYTPSGPDSGTIASTGGFANVVFNDFEHLHIIGALQVNGTSGDDLLVINATGPDSGTYTLNGTSVHFSGQIGFIFNGGDGDDVMQINNPAGGLFAPIDGIFFNGQGQDGDGNVAAGTTSGDELQIFGGLATTAEFDYTNANDGVITYDSSQVITYTGLEPISSTITATDVILNYSTASEVISISNSAGDTTVNSTVGEVTTFVNPTGTLTINAGDTGVNTINIDSLAASYPATIDINGGDGGDTVNINGAVGLAANRSLNVDAATINLPNGTSDVITSGDGAVVLTADRNIEMNSGTSITTDSGAITLNANAGGVAGNFDGILVDDATITSTMGAISLTGQSGDISGNNGVVISSGAVVSSTGTGVGAATITIDGTGLGANVYNGVFIGNSGTQVTSADGAVSIVGSTSGEFNGVEVSNGGLVSSTGVGMNAATISIDGTATGTNSESGVFVGDPSSTVTSVDGNISIIGSASAYDGVGIENGAEVTSTGIGMNAATISIDGTSTSTPGDGFDGVFISDTDTLVSSVDGNVTIIGDSTDRDGVAIGPDAEILSTGLANVDITGTSSGVDGVSVFEASVTSTTAGSITITGTGTVGNDPDADGVYMDEGSISTQGSGNILITGTASVHGNDGVDLFFDTLIESTSTAMDAGTITIMGTSGTQSVPGESPDGVDINDDSIVTSANGNIIITGDAVMNGDDGVDIDFGGLVESTGIGPNAATITIIGTAATGADDGVDIDDFGTMASVDGDILIDGTSTDETGVEIATPIAPIPASSIVATGAANIAITGIGTDGVAVVGPGTTVSTNMGSVVITAPGLDTIVLGGLISTDGSTVTLNGTVQVIDPPPIDTTNAGNTPAGADVTFDGILEIGIVSLGNHDVVEVLGTVDLGTGGNEAALAVDLSGAMINEGESFVIIENDGIDSVVGTFDGLPEGTILTLANSGWTGAADAFITYVGGSGNDVELKLTPKYDFSLASYDVHEMDASHTTNTVTVIRSGNTSAVSSIDVILTANTAEANDFMPGPLTVGFAAGETSKTVPIGIIGDTLVELDETIGLSFANLIGGGVIGVAQPTSTLTIIEDDHATVSIDDLSLVESNNFVFTVSLSNPVDIVTTVQADTSNGSAGIFDFIPVVGETLTFPAGSQTQTVAVQSTADFLSEIDESFFVELSNINAGGRNVAFTDAQGRGTIIDIPLLAIDDVTVVEGDSGVTTALVTARLSEALTADLFVEYEVQAGTATAAEDYFTMSGNFTIPAGDLSFEFPISIAGDVLGEANETFTVVVEFLDSPGNVVAAGDSRAVVTIQNDDGLNVVGVKVGSTEWDPAFRAFIDPSSADFGYPIPTGSGQLDPLPWAHLNQVQLEFNSDISSSFSENLFGLGGFHTADYHSHVTSTVYNSSDFTVTMTLNTFLGDDQVVVVASDLLTIAGGDALDGEWTTGQASNVSGDGSPGGNFEFRFDVLPGDVDQSGGLSSNDGFAALRLQTLGVGDVNYLAFADVDGSGSISSNDGFFALARQSTELPKGTPTVPLLPQAAKVDLAVAAMARIDDDELGKMSDEVDMDELVDNLVADLQKRRNASHADQHTGI